MPSDGAASSSSLNVSSNRAGCAGCSRTYSGANGSSVS